MVNKLTDYQITEAFGNTLSLIYKEKFKELNEDLSPVYEHLDSLDVPRYTDLDRWFAREALPGWAKERFRSIEHIQKIKNMWRKMKTQPESEKLDIERAKAVPIESLYPMARRGGNVSCFRHEDKHPSAKLNKNNTIKCFQCGFFGDSVSVFMALHNVGFKEAVLGLGKM